MLSERMRNTLVGFTLLVSLALLMYGILLLGKFQLGRPGTYYVTVVTSNANGVTAGASVDINGVVRGEVASVDLTIEPATAPASAAATSPTPPVSRMVVWVRLKIDNAVNIPVGSRVVLGKQTIGTAYVSILVSEVTGPMLSHDGSGILSAEPAETGLIPRDVLDDVRALKLDLSTLSHELTAVAHDLHALLIYTPPETIDSANPNDPSRPHENVSTVIVRLDRTMKSLETLLTDPKLQGQIREAVQNIADASRELRETLKTIDTTAKNANSAMTAFNTAATSVGAAADKFGGAATQASAVLQSTQQEVFKVSQHLADTLGEIERTVHQIGQGNGTAGKLINDPRLYDGLVDLSKSLRVTVDDLDFLLKKWKDEGVEMRLK